MSKYLRAIDALVAEKVMGWTWVRRDSGYHHYRTPSSLVVYDTEWAPTENIADAWRVIEKLDAYLFDITQHNRWQVGVCRKLGWRANETRYVSADTAPLAVCLAALKALGVELPEEGEG